MRRNAPSPPVPPLVLTSETLQAEQIARATDGATAQRGRAYYYQKRARIESAGPQRATLLVQGSRPRPYRVTVAMNRGGEILCDCECPAFDDYMGPCKHIIAAALTLSDHLQRHPPTNWETILTDALRGKAKRPAITAPARSLLLFSLQKRASRWAVYAYALPASRFSEDERQSAETVARAIRERKLATEATVVRSANARRFVGADGPALQAAQLLASMPPGGGGGYGYYYGPQPGCEMVLPLLTGSLVFRGREADPFQKPVRVLAEPAAPRLALWSDPETLRLVPEAQIGEDRRHGIPLEKAEVLAADPLWLLADDCAFAVEEAPALFSTLLERSGLDIPAADEDAFLERYLVPIAHQIPVEGGGLSWEEVGDFEPIPRLYLSESDGAALQAHLRFGYGPYELPFDKDLPESSTRRKPESRTLVRLRRRPEREQAAFDALSGFHLKRGSEPGQFTLRLRTDPVDFLLHQVPRLAGAGFEVYGEEALTAARVNRSRPTLSLSVSSGIDWFDVKAVVHFGEIEASLTEIRRAIRRRERYVKLADGSIGQIPDEWLEKYRHLFALGEETDAGAALRLSTHHLTLLEQAIADAEGAVQTDAEFERRRERLRSFTEIRPEPLPEGFAGTLRPYQKAGYDWLHFLHEYEFGGCLADDMGVGKTVQALAFLQALKERGESRGAASLIVMPRSLLFNWEREARRFAPDLKLLTYADNARARDTGEFDGYDLVLTTYGILLRDIESLRKYRFHYAILDEAQAIKNPLALTSRAARLLQADHRLSLSGTPVENSALELWSQFAFLNPGLLGGLDYFRDAFAGAIERQQDDGAARLLRRLVHPFILRRTKDQVAPELPPRTERLMLAEMEPAQRKLYNRWRDHYRAQVLGLLDRDGMNRARMKMLEGLLRLRQICNHPRLVEPEFRGRSAKFDALLETLETLRAEGHKALVFSQFVQMLTLLRTEMDARGIPYAYLDGRTRDRQARVDSFQNDASLPFFLISLKAGGVGLNLTAADYVLHVDPWWNPAVEMQATDRTHRIGQERPVFVHKFVMRDSVEEKILQLQERKRGLVEQLITTESGFLKALTRDDVAALFT